MVNAPRAGDKKLRIALLAILLVSVVDRAPGGLNQANRELEMTVRVDNYAESRSRVPKFRVEIRNVSDHDLILNLGIMQANGRKQYADAVVLTIVDAQGKARQFELRGPAYIAGRADPLIVPLPVGSMFSVAVDLDKYWAAASKESEYKWKPGAYSLEAQFSGKGVSQQEANLDVKGIALLPYWIGNVTSNRLQFQVDK